MVNLVNLRFISEYHGVAAEVVMDRRGRGERFVVMNNHYYKEKGKKHHGDDGGKGKDDRWDKHDKDHKGKEKGHGKGRDD
ncbi:MAG: hypothetical protein A4E67_00667 [Syntrophaceae bacterium PtaB.Bin038]|nr:MAG: hypothetical protein A4E67_00667 [Syntrophaceae bacterium PtaB.Bin038]